MAFSFLSGVMRNRLLMKFFALFCASFIAGVLFLHSTIRLNASVVRKLFLVCAPCLGWLLILQALLGWFTPAKVEAYSKHTESDSPPMPAVILSRANRSSAVWPLYLYNDTSNTFITWQWTCFFKWILCFLYHRHYIHNVPYWHGTYY